MTRLTAHGSRLTKKSRRPSASEAVGTTKGEDGKNREEIRGGEGAGGDQALRAAGGDGARPRGQVHEIRRVRGHRDAPRGGPEARRPDGPRDSRPASRNGQVQARRGDRVG